MIRTTIDPVFSAFGTVRDRAAVGVPMALMPGAPVALYCFDRDTHWDYLEGMTLLLVQDGDAQRQFYLDRAITIRAGVIFGFFCLSAGSRILGEADLPAPLQTVQAPILPEERPLQLFTLFHQKAAEGLYFRGEQHPPVELVYLEHGCLHNYCGGRDLVLHPRELLLFDREQWHMQVADESVQFLTVSFLWEGHDFSPWAGQVISASAEVQQAAKALLAEYHRQLPGREEFLRAQLKLLLLQLLRQPADLTRHRTSPATEQMRRQVVDQALQVVSARVRSRLTVPELASAVNVSSSQLTRLFQTYLGISPAKHITRARLEEAKALLCGGDRSVGEVAELLGYASIQHFSRQFHEWIGCTPTAYAQKFTQQR